MHARQSRVQFERLAIVLRSALQVSVIDQALRDYLLHAGGTRCEDRQFIQRLVGQIKINTLSHIQDFDVVRVDVNQRLHHGSGAVEVALLGVDSRQFQTHLDLQVFIFQFWKGFLEKRLGGTLSQSSFANSQKSLRFRQRRVNRESVTQILGSGLIVMLKERYDTQIRIGLGVMGIERQDSS